MDSTIQSHSINWTPQLLSHLSRAEYAMGKLAGIASQFPSPHLLSQAFCLKEAVYSARCAGATASFDAVLRQQAELPTQISAEDQQTINRSLLALKFGVRRLQSHALDQVLITELYEKLAPEQKTPEPLSPQNHLPPLLSAAVTYQQIIASQPYPAHNDQFARLLLSMWLIGNKQLPFPLLTLSHYFERSTDQHYSYSYNVVAHGDWNSWLNYFLMGVTIQAERNAACINTMRQHLTDWSKQCAKESKTLPGKIVNRLAVCPYLTAKSVAKKFDVAFTTAQRTISKLEDLGIVESVNDAQRNKIFYAKSLLDALNKPKGQQ